MVNSVGDGCKDEDITVIKQIIVDLKYLMTCSFSKFWSTLRFNNFIQSTMESFLHFSMKQDRVNSMHDNEQKLLLMRELYRVVFCFYDRILMCYVEDSDKAKEFNCYGIIYDFWLVDIPKIMDLLMIYRFQNDQKLKGWINQMDLRNKEYKDDFKNYIDMVII